MGKTTLYHPVSLHVIRGSAELGGFQFGKLKQMWSDRETLTARYEATIQQIPSHLEGLYTMDIQEALQECFMDDIAIHWVHFTKNGILCCQISVQLNRNATLDEIAEDAIATYHLEAGRA